MGNIHALPARDVRDVGYHTFLHDTRHAKAYGRNLMARAKPAKDIQGPVRVLHHLVIGIRPYGKFLSVYDIPYAVGHGAYVHIAVIMESYDIVQLFIYLKILGPAPNRRILHIAELYLILLHQDIDGLVHRHQAQVGQSCNLRLCN